MSTREMKDKTLGGFPVLVMSFNYRQIGPDEGLTFKELVRDLKFEMACDLLAASNAPIAQIAEMLGYSDQTVFFRAFSHHFGCPPSQLRNIQR